MYIEKYPWMSIDDDWGRPRSVPDRPIRPSPSCSKKTAPFPSYPWTDNVWPSRPVLGYFGRTGWLRTLDDLDNADILTLRWFLAGWLSAGWTQSGRASCWLAVRAGSRLAGRNVNRLRAGWISWVLGFRILFYRRGRRSRYIPSNSYTLGLSTGSILIGWMNLPRGTCGSCSVRYSGGYYSGYLNVDAGYIPKTYKFLERHQRR